jgi:DNA topoisomerase-3
MSEFRYPIAITEKPSQKKNVDEAVGSSFKAVLAAQGHLCRMLSPDEVKEEWRGPWSGQNYALLYDGREYGWVPDDADGKGPRYDRLRAELLKADCVYIACDNDREGQLIGEMPLRLLGYKGPIRRMWFNDELPGPLREAFTKAKSNAEPEYANLFQAGWARHEIDQIFGMTLTRAATVAFGSKYLKKALSVGRVKTAVVTFVVRRELEIRNFVKTPYFVIEAGVDPGGDKSRRLVLRNPDPKNEKITDRSDAERIASAIAGQEAALVVRSRNRSQSPPLLLDQGKIQKACSDWGWSVKKASDVLQYLYQDAHLVTYPGTDGRHLPDDYADHVPGMLNGLKNLGLGPVPASPVIRRGKDGHFSTASLAGKPHHAIVPKFATVSGVEGDAAAAYARLDRDQKRLFDYIALYYIAAVSADHLYKSTSISMTLAIDGKDRVFATTGNVVTQGGWKSVLGLSGEDEDPDTQANLPDVADGEVAKVATTGLSNRETRPPPRYSEGAVVDQMREIWRLVPEGPDRDRLIESEGIGRPRTRGPAVTELLNSGQLQIQGKHVVPAEDSIKLIQLFDQIAPELLDYAISARWETRLDAVAAGKATRKDLVRDVADFTDTILAKIKANAGRIVFNGTPSKPTKPMIDAAKSIAERKKLTLPRSALRDFDACREFLNEHGEKRDPNAAPSKDQLELAEKLQKETGLPLGEDVRASTAELRKWIDQAILKSPPQEKQLAFARKLSGETGRSLTTAELASRKLLSEAIDTMLKLQSKAGGKTRGGKKPPSGKGKFSSKGKQ